MRTSTRQKEDYYRYTESWIDQVTGTFNLLNPCYYSRMPTTQKSKAMMKKIEELAHDIDVAKSFIDITMMCLKYTHRYRGFFPEIKSVCSTAAKILEALEACDKIEMSNKKMTEDQTKRHETNLYDLLQGTRSWHKKAKDLIKRFNSFPNP